jgi:hypothetical protein
VHVMPLNDEEPHTTHTQKVYGKILRVKARRAPCAVVLYHTVPRVTNPVTAFTALHYSFTLLRR